MPFCDVVHPTGIYEERKFQKLESENAKKPVKIYYQLYGHGDIKVLLIIGLAGTHDAWAPQILSLAGTITTNEEEERLKEAHNCFIDSQTPVGGVQERRKELSNREDSDKVDVLGTGIQICSFDNRGVGKSTVPEKKSKYTTSIMAKDALAIMDHLGWEKVHVFGHSMGAMISCKLAAMVPERIASLALISVTGGGYQCLPKADKTLISIVFRFIKARTPEERACVDLDTHYTKDYLDADAGGISRRDLLYKEYVKNIAASGMQSKYGFNGHIYACLTHRVTSEELQRIISCGILVSVIHGCGDIIAQMRYGRAFAQKLYPVARMLELPGGHLVTHQNTTEVELFCESEDQVWAIGRQRMGRGTVVLFSWPTCVGG
eukprot:c27328_g1_i3 orf=549-1676(-)